MSAASGRHGRQLHGDESGGHAGSEQVSGVMRASARRHDMHKRNAKFKCKI